MSEFSVIQDEVILHEMMTHPVIFSHPDPHNVAVHGDPDQRILQEALKHASLTNIAHKQPHADPRVKTINDAEEELFDVVITTEKPTPATLKKYMTSLKHDGILLQQCDSPLDISFLKSLQQQLKKLDFSDVQTLIFSQPHFISGWRCALMAKKQGVFKRIREKDIYNRPFKTYFYNTDTHRAALALPEFIRNELITEEVY